MQGTDDEDRAPRPVLVVPLHGDPHTPCTEVRTLPVHRVAVEDVEDAIAAIQRTEKIITSAAIGDGALLVITEKKIGRPAKETR